MDIKIINTIIDQVQFEQGFGLFLLVALNMKIQGSNFENIGHNFNFLTSMDTLTLANRRYFTLIRPIIYVYLMVSVLSPTITIGNNLTVGNSTFSNVTAY